MDTRLLTICFLIGVVILAFLCIKLTELKTKNNSKSSSAKKTIYLGSSALAIFAGISTSYNISISLYALMVFLIELIDSCIPYFGKKTQL